MRCAVFDTKVPTELCEYMTHARVGAVAVPGGAHALGSTAGERHDHQVTFVAEVPHDPVGQCERLLRRVIDALILEAAAGERRELPDVTGQAAFRVRRPDLAILDDLVLEAVTALVRLTDRAVRVAFRLREPKQRLVVRC